ncbi:hypothetical protein NPIL_101731, partial [Nephila pilipes]
ESDDSSGETLFDRAAGIANRII